MVIRYKMRDSTEDLETALLSIEEFNKANSDEFKYQWFFESIPSSNGNIRYSLYIRDIGDSVQCFAKGKQGDLVSFVTENKQDILCSL